MDEKKSIKAGIIGCGDISPAHLKTYQRCGIELAALCDRDAARAEARRDEYGSANTPVFTDHRDLLAIDDMDIVTVATPVAAHVPLTIDALRAGKHVVCEKPSALSIAENRMVIDACKETGGKVAFCSARMRGGYNSLAKHYVEDGDLGEIYHIEVTYYRRRGRPGLDCVVGAHWFLDSALAGGGIIMDMGQYFMDAVMNIAGWPKVRAVSGTKFRGFEHDLPAEVKFDVEEHCTFLARAEGDLTITFDLAWISHHTPRRCITILGTKGGLRMDQEAPFTFFSNKGGPWHWMNTTTEWKDKSNGNDVIYQGMIDVVNGRRDSVGTTPEEALAITELTQMALKSAELGREVRLDELE